MLKAIKHCYLHCDDASQKQINNTLTPAAILLTAIAKLKATENYLKRIRIRKRACVSMN